MAYLSKGIAVDLPGITIPGLSARPRKGPVERDLSTDLVPLLGALRRFGEDGDAACALVAPLSDEVRANLAREMVRRPSLFGAPVIRAVLASTPKIVLGCVLGPHAASVAWRCYVM